jgi:hypothetical protein
VFDQASVDPERDLPRVREIELVNSKLSFIQDGQFGHWRISNSVGLLPVKLQGVWLSFEDAKRAALLYFNQKRKIPKDSPYYDDSMHVSKSQEG